jgi:hypothetical protein
MKSHIEIGGTTPSDEACSSVGDESYAFNARCEGRAFINQIKRQFGDKLKKLIDEGRIELIIKSNPHDLGSYYEVVAKFNDDDEYATGFAYRIENTVATDWDDEARIEMGLAEKEITSEIEEEEDEEEEVEYDYPENETEYDFHDLASSWHNGQFSEMYKYASSGTIDSKEGLINEINACVMAVSDAPSAYDEDEAEKLEAFIAWAENIHIIVGPKEDNPKKSNPSHREQLDEYVHFAEKNSETLFPATVSDIKLSRAGHKELWIDLEEPQRALSHYIHMGRFAVGELKDKQVENIVVGDKIKVQLYMSLGGVLIDKIFVCKKV